jgi:hypothetical protein
MSDKVIHVSHSNTLKSGLTDLKRITISKLSFCSLVPSITRKLSRPFGKFLSVKLAF